MQTEAEQRRYLRARNQAFPEAPWNLDALRYLLGSPSWAAGTSYTAFSSDEVVGSVLVHWDPEENRRNGRHRGYTEDIFVLAGGRERGIASYLIIQGLLYLRGSGLAEAHVQVGVDNIGALAIYERLGYQTPAAGLVAGARDRVEAAGVDNLALPLPGLGRYLLLARNSRLAEATADNVHVVALSPR